MATVDERNVTSFGGGKSNFWGLTQQNGPWATTKNDRRNASGRAPQVVGGGLGAGGTDHAGHGRFKSVSNPYQQNARKPPPAPSVYAQRRVVVKAQNPNFSKPISGLRAGIPAPLGKSVLPGSQGIVKREDFHQAEASYPSTEPLAGRDQHEPEIKIEPKDEVMMRDTGTSPIKGREGRERGTSPVRWAAEEHAMFKDTEAQTMPLVESSFSTEHQMTQTSRPELTSFAQQTDVPSISGVKRKGKAVLGGHPSGISRVTDEYDQDNIMQLGLNVGVPIHQVPVETYKPPRSTLTIEAGKQAEEDVKKEVFDKPPLRKSARKTLRSKPYDVKHGAHEAKLRVKKLEARVKKLSGPKGDSIKLKKAKTDLENAKLAEKKFQ